MLLLLLLLMHTAAKYLPRKQYLNILAAVCEYGINGEEPSGLNPVERAMFEAFRPQIDANAKRREDGKKGGRPKQERVTEETYGFENEKPVVFEDENLGFENEKPNDNENVNENENDNVNVNENAHTMRAQPSGYSG